MKHVLVIQSTNTDFQYVLDIITWCWDYIKKSEQKWNTAPALKELTCGEGRYNNKREAHKYSCAVRVYSRLVGEAKECVSGKDTCICVFKEEQA